MIVLGLDTSTSACSAALWAEGRVLARRAEAMARGQSEALAPMTAQVLADAGLGIDEIGLIGVTVGPGAFTGLRIGLAFARALALAARQPLAGVASTWVIAHQVPARTQAGRMVLAAVESKRDDIYLQAFDAGMLALGPPQACPPALAASLVSGPVVVAGDGAPRVLEYLPEAVALPQILYPDAACVAEQAFRLWQSGTALPPEPLYLRPADVTVPS